VIDKPKIAGMLFGISCVLLMCFSLAETHAKEKKREAVGGDFFGN
jgi:hypothetical protein